MPRHNPEQPQRRFPAHTHLLQTNQQLLVAGESLPLMAAKTGVGQEEMFTDPVECHAISDLSVRVPLVGPDDRHIEASEAIAPLAQRLAPLVGDLLGRAPENDTVTFGNKANLALAEDGRLSEQLFGKTPDMQRIPERRIHAFAAALARLSFGHLSYGGTPGSNGLRLIGSVRRLGTTGTSIRILLATDERLTDGYNAIRAALGQEAKRVQGIWVLTYRAQVSVSYDTQAKLDAMLGAHSNNQQLRQLRLGAVSIFSCGICVARDPSVPALQVDWLSAQRPAATAPRTRTAAAPNAAGPGGATRKPARTSGQTRAAGTRSGSTAQKPPTTQPPSASTPRLTSANGPSQEWRKGYTIPF